MIFHQFFEKESSTYTYLIASEQTHEAVLIDPVASEIESYAKKLNEHNLTLVYSLDTHVHADHVTAANLLREKSYREKSRVTYFNIIFSKILSFLSFSCLKRCNSLYI